MEEKGMAASTLTEAARKQDTEAYPALIAAAEEELRSQVSFQALCRYLSDTSTLATCGALLRRCVRAARPEIAAACGLPADKNAPWPDAALEKAAGLLQKETDRKPISIKRGAWMDYLADRKQPRRDMIFKIAYVLELPREELEKLLLVCGYETFNCRDPWDLILLNGFTSRPRATWMEMEARYACYCADGEAARPAGGTDAAAGQTIQLRTLADRSLESGLPGDKLLAQLEENRARLIGCSLRRRADFLRFVEYIAALYPELVRQERVKKAEGMAEGMTSSFLMPVNGEDGQPILRRLVGALFDENGWAANPDEEKTDAGQPPLQKRLWELCGGYYNHLNGIERTLRRPSHAEPVERQDILLFGYFLLAKIAFCQAQDGALPDGLLALSQPAPGKAPSDFDRMMQTLLASDLPQEDCDARERADRIERVLNRLLGYFDFYPLYHRNVLDRFLYLSLLTEDPMEITSRLVEGPEKPLPAEFTAPASAADKMQRW